MKSTEARVIEMLIRVRQFGLTHASSFPAASSGAELLSVVAGAIENMEGHSADQSQHTRAARQQTRQKAAARHALRETMEAISRTARAMTRSTPGVQEKFRLPEDAREQSLLATARSFAADAEPLKDEFVRRGMPTTFLDDLRAQIQIVEQSLDGRAQKSAARVLATAAVAEAAESGRRAVRELDAVVRNVFSNDHSALAEWESASRVERAPHRSRQDAPAPATSPAKA
jgi:hypothetical protein